MSRFYLVEFRYPRHRRWHPWMREYTLRRAKKEVEEMESAGDPGVRWRYVLIDTDSPKVHVP